jgi:hypothetical protein
MNLGAQRRDPLLVFLRATLPPASRIGSDHLFNCHDLNHRVPDCGEH